jgi:hypothetical protein
MGTVLDFVTLERKPYRSEIHRWDFCLNLAEETAAGNPRLSLPEVTGEGDGQHFLKQCFVERIPFLGIDHVR